MTIILTIIMILGSIALFLYGMNLLSDGLQKTAGVKLRKVLAMMTGSRIAAVLTGALVTVIIQSSSATTVMVVSFVNAGLMNLVSAIGVIMGANIGTTVTGWIVSLLGFSVDITSLSLAAMAVALPLMFSKKNSMKELSQLLIGFGFLFIGLEFIKRSMPDIGSHPEILSFLSRFNNGNISSLLLAILVGAVATCIAQSSSATMALTITLAYQGWIGIWTAAALCLGQNIGTTITAFIASLGTTTSAKRAAVAHIMFNVIGAFIALIFFTPLMRLVNFITPGDIFISEVERTPTFLAAFHTTFNLINTLLFFPFVRQYAHMIERLIPERTGYSEGTYHFKYIAKAGMSAPEPYIVALMEEVRKMGSLAVVMFTDYMALYEDESNIADKSAAMRKKEDFADQMQEQLIDYAIKILQDSESPTYASSLNSLIRVIDETESITDTIYNLTRINEDRIKRGLRYSEDEKEAIRTSGDITLEFLKVVTDEIGKDASAENFEKARKLEAQMDGMKRTITDKILSEINSENKNILTELITLDVVRSLEHIGDYCENIAEALFKTFDHTPEIKKL